MAMTHYAPAKVPVEIAFEDEHYLVVNKPSGLLSVPGKDPQHSDCMWSRVMEICPEAVFAAIQLATCVLSTSFTDRGWEEEALET